MYTLNFFLKKVYVKALQVTIMVFIENCKTITYILPCKFYTKSKQVKSSPHTTLLATSSRRHTQITLRPENKYNLITANLIQVLSYGGDFCLLYKRNG